jgi:hypothetical protein
MPGFEQIENEDELLKLLEQLPPAAEAPSIDTSSLDALMEQATPAQPAPAAEDWRPAGEESGLEGLDVLLAAEGGRAPAADPLSAPDGSAPSKLPKDAGKYVLDENGRPYSVPDKRDDLLAARDRARELYQAQAQDAEPQGAGEEELRFVSMNYRPSMKDIRRAWVIQSLLGDKGDAGKLVGILQEQARYYDQGLAQARAADRQSRPKRADLATAEVAALSGLSPEAASSMSESSRALDLLKAGGINIGKGLRGQDTQVLTTDTKEVGETYRDRMGEMGKNQRAADANATQLEAARIRKRGGQGTGAPAVNDPAGLAAYLSQQANVPLDMAKAYASGTLDQSAVDPQTLERLEVAATLFSAGGAKDRMQMIKGREGNEGANVDAAGRAADVKRADPQYRLKLKQETNAIGMPLREAIVSYNRLSPRARDIVAKVGLSGNLSQLREAGLSAQEQADVGAVISQINNAVKAMSGAAVSTSEWQRLGASMGVTGEGFSPFKSSAGLGAWLQRAKREFAAQRAAIEQEFPGVLSGGQ